jgi:hypothetical protein
MPDNFMRGFRAWGQSDNAKERFEIREWLFWFFTGARKQINGGARFHSHGFAAVGGCAGGPKVALKVGQGRFHEIRLSDKLIHVNGEKEKAAGWPAAFVIL